MISYLKLPGDTPVIFSHPLIAKNLVIPTGMNQIAWGYRLNTQVTPTYGGETVQVLSCFIDAVTLSGSTRDNKQLRDIYTWFLTYMQVAGLRTRSEKFITMQYPTRNWNFWLQVTQLPNFQQHRDLLGTDWTVQAEIVADDASSYSVLTGHTMEGFYQAAFDPHMFDIGFTNNDPRNSTPLEPDLGSRIGDNMQSLIGAWATGNFGSFAFDATREVPADNKLKSAQDYWSQVLGGSDILIPGSSGSSSGTVGYAGGVPQGRVQIAGAIAAAAAGKHIPGYIMVASALVESGLNPDARQAGGDHAIGLFQTFPTGAGGGQKHRNELVAAFNDSASKVTKHYPTLDQIDDAVGWWSGHTFSGGDAGEYAQRAQGAGDPAYPSKVNAQIANAKALINQYQASVGNASSKALRAVQFAVAAEGTPYVWGGESPHGYDCSGLTQAAYQVAGVSIPRTSQAQWAASFPKVSKNNIRAGDLVYAYPGEQGPGPGHVLIYKGGGKVVHAPHTGEVVQEGSVSFYFSDGIFVGINRPAP